MHFHEKFQKILRIVSFDLNIGLIPRNFKIEVLNLNLLFLRKITKIITNPGFERIHPIFDFHDFVQDFQNHM